GTENVRFTAHGAQLAVVARQSVDAEAVGAAAFSVRRLAVASPRECARRHSHLVCAGTIKILDLPVGFSVDAGYGGIDLDGCLGGLAVRVADVANEAEAVRDRGWSDGKTQSGQRKGKSPAGPPPVFPIAHGREIEVDAAGVLNARPVRSAERVGRAP